MTMKTATTQELLEIVGSGREMHPSAAVAAAEAELLRRTAGDEDRLLVKVRRAGTVCAVLGGFFVFWGLCMAVFGMTLFGPRGVQAYDEPFIFRHFGAIYVTNAILQAITGGVLLKGGLALRKLRRRGRILVQAVIGIGFVFLAVFAITWIGSLPWRDGPLSMATAMSVGGLLITAFWGFLLWLPYRFFTSSRVRAACGE